MRITGFEWDESNILYLELKYGISPMEAEEVFFESTLYRRTKMKHYAAFGKSFDGRYLTIIFEKKEKGLARVITGWDMSDSEKKFYLRHF